MTYFLINIPAVPIPRGPAVKHRDLITSSTLLSLTVRRPPLSSCCFFVCLVMLNVLLQHALLDLAAAASRMSQFRIRSGRELVIAACVFPIRVMAIHSPASILFFSLSGIPSYYRIGREMAADP